MQMNLFKLHCRGVNSICGEAKYTQKLRGMEINLFKFHSRSATVYVAAGQIYVEAESRTNLYDGNVREKFI